MYAKVYFIITRCESKHSLLATSSINKLIVVLINNKSYGKNV